MKHTPGPWQYHTEQYRNLIGGPDHLKVADVWTSDRPDEERMANARLIAASPDLYTACRAALMYIMDDDRLDTAGTLYDTLTDAIRKAEGGES